ncbi:MAG: metallophosphoesterase [Cyanobacteria bacterium]|nr:metallophosphoesterase [Cyanobacteriota bacterium]
MVFKRRQFLTLAAFSGFGIGAIGFGLRSLAVKKDVNPTNPTSPTLVPTLKDSLGPLQLRLIATADSGSGDKNQFAVGRAMADYHTRSPFQLAILAGDNIYNSGEISKIKEAFEEPYGELLKRGVKFRACLGNHDIRTENGIPQVKYADFNMDDRYYTFTQGPAQFFVLETNTNVDWKTQMAWLTQQLEQSKAAWKIVYGHHPIYSSGVYGTNAEMVKRFSAVFKKHRVNLYVNGHEHHYERSRNIEGTTYLVTGHGGASLRPVRMSKSSEFAVSRFGFSTIELYQNSMVIQGIGTDGSVFDRGIIPQWA